MQAAATGAEHAGELSIRSDGPPFHFQKKRVAPGPPGTKQVFVVPLDDENRARLERGMNGPFEVRFYSGYGRSVRIDVSAR